MVPCVYEVLDMQMTPQVSSNWWYFDSKFRAFAMIDPWTDCEDGARDNGSWFSQRVSLLQDGLMAICYINWNCEKKSELTLVTITMMQFCVCGSNSLYIYNLTRISLDFNFFLRMTSLSLCFLLGLHHQVPSLFTKEIHHPERKKILKMLLLKETLARISPVTYLWCVTTCWDMGWHGDTDNVVWIVSPHVLTPKYFSLFLLNIQIFNPHKLFLPNCGHLLQYCYIWGGRRM